MSWLTCLVCGSQQEHPGPEVDAQVKHLRKQLALAEASLRAAEERAAEAHRTGWMAAVDKAVKMVRYHCDCKHADIPGLVGLL